MQVETLDDRKTGLIIKNDPGKLNNKISLALCADHKKKREYNRGVGKLLTEKIMSMVCLNNIQCSSSLQVSVCLTSRTIRIR